MHSTENPTPAATSPEGGLVDARSAARLLDVPPTWLLARARAGAIPHVRLGRYVRFETPVLRSWWEAQRRGPTMTRPEGA